MQHMQDARVLWNLERVGPFFFVEHVGGDEGGFAVFFLILMQVWIEMTFSEAAWLSITFSFTSDPKAFMSAESLVNDNFKIAEGKSLSW